MQIMSCVTSYYSSSYSRSWDEQCLPAARASLQLAMTRSPLRCSRSAFTVLLFSNTCSINSIICMAPSELLACAALGLLVFDAERGREVENEAKLHGKGELKNARPREAMQE